MTLRLALVGGPMYDGLYRLLDGLDAEVVIHADHPTLNRQAAAALAAGTRIDVLSTHGKYAPSQRQWLRPLDDLIRTDELAPRAVDLCRDADGALLCVPRNIDVRVLWRRTDLVPMAPDSWAAIVQGDQAFGFPQRDSGLFGTFYELILGQGGDLFALEPDIAASAAETLCALRSRLPQNDWHYDDVDAALGSGTVAMAGAWPGGTGALRAMPMGGRLAPSPYPAGPARRVTYAGCHGWAIPTTAGDVPAAVALIQRLAGIEGSTLEAASGGIAAHIAAAAAMQPADDVDALRLDLTREAIASQMATYPPHPNFAAFEDAGWRLVADCIAGKVPPGDLAGHLAAAQHQLLADRQ